MRCLSIASGLLLALTGLVMLAAAPAAIADPNCTCRYRGQSYTVKSCVCINRSDGPQLACCELVLNNTSWSFSDKGCPTASKGGPGLVQSARGPYSPMPETLQERR